MKNKIKRIIECLIFVAIFVCLFEKASLIVKVYGKGYENTRNSALFYYLPRNTVDVIFLGDSRSFTTYVNKDIYDNSGITCATLSGASSSIINCYWELKEAFTRQKKVKLVIMDIQTIRNSICAEDFNDRPLAIISGLTPMPETSLNKWMCYLDIKRNKFGAYDKMTIYDAIGLVLYREDTERVYSLSELVNLMFMPEKEFKMFGYYPLNKGVVYPLEELKIVNNTNDRYEFIYSKEYEYFNKILNLCKCNNCELLLTNLPFYGSNNDKYVTEQVEKYVKENRIEYIDYFGLTDKTGIDLSTDFMDQIHFNYLGAKKITNYITKYLISTNKFYDHRGDNKYILWENNRYDYKQYENELN